jgi:hypothetical protein
MGHPHCPIPVSLPTATVTIEYHVVKSLAHPLRWKPPSRSSLDRPLAFHRKDLP